MAKRFCEEFEEATGIKTEFHFFGDYRRLNSDIEVTLFRVIQEALINVRKHSKARTCLVKLEYGNERINLVVADDGIGFETGVIEGKSDERHFGLMTIKERVDLISGSFNIESAPGQGTKIYVSVPFDI